MKKLLNCKEKTRMVDIGVLEEDFSYEISFPSFAIPKKNGSSTIRAATDFRKQNFL
jgi:hypothetical protein